MAETDARPAPSPEAWRLIDECGQAWKRAGGGPSDYPPQRGWAGELIQRADATDRALSAYVAGLEAEVARLRWRLIDGDTPRDRPILLTDGENSGQGFWHDGSERHPSKGGAGWFDEMDRGNLLTAREWFGVVGWMDLPDPRMDAAALARLGAEP